MPLLTTTLTGLYLDLVGQPIAGLAIELSITPDALVNATDNQLIPFQTRQAVTGLDGRFTITNLIRSDDPLVQPAGWTYLVREMFGARRAYAILLTGAGPHELADVAPVPSSAGVGVALGPVGPAGATGAAGPGVAVGGTAGQVLTKVTGTNYDTGWAAFGAPDKPAGGALARIGKARTGAFRVLQVGTSIASFDQSPNQVLAAHLKRLYGDAYEFVQPGGNIGGNYTDAFSGWVKQPFGGLITGRSRGDSTSADLVFNNYYCDTVVVEFSKETGGGFWDVQIDGVTVGTINSGGAQAYGQKATFTTTLGPHVVTCKKPATGFAYLEAIRFEDSTARGVAVIDGTKGGSALANTQILATGGVSGPTAGVAIVGWNGLDSIFGRTDVDLIVCDHLVNDSSQPLVDFKTRVDRAIDVTAANQTPLLWIVDPGGHFAMPADSGYAWVRDARQYLIDQVAEHSHFFLLDWHALTAMTDLVAYAAKFYDGVTITNLATGTYMGDFIHPNTAAAQIATSALHALVGLAPPPYSTKSSGVTYQRTVTDAKATAASTITTVAGLPKAYAVAEGTAAKHFGENPVRRVPYLRDNAVSNFADTVADAIAASVTSDSYGKYVTYANSAQTVGGTFDFTTGERLVLTIKARGAVSILPGSAEGGKIYVNGVALPGPVAHAFNITLDPVIPSVITLEVGYTAGGAVVVLTGTFYEFCATRSTVPILTTKPTASLRELGTPALLIDDPAYNEPFLGNLFYELLPDGTTQVEKKLIGRCNKFSTVTQTATDVGLYEARDRSAAGHTMVRVRGTKTPVADAFYAGYAETSTEASWEVLGLVNLAAANRYTATLRLPPNTSSIRLYLFNGGNNGIRFLNPNGTWTSTAANAWEAPPPQLVGRMVSITFDGPTAEAVTLGDTPSMFVTCNGAPRYGTLVAVKGRLSCA